MNHSIALTIALTALLLTSASPAAAELEWSVGWGDAAAPATEAAPAPDAPYAPTPDTRQAPAPSDSAYARPYGSPSPDTDTDTEAESASEAAPAGAPSHANVGVPGIVEVIAETHEMTAQDLPRRTLTVDVTEGDDPLAGERVLLHVMRMPHDLLATYASTTDAQGEATFEIAIPPDTEAFAQVTRERSFFSRQPVALDREGALRTRVVLPGLSRDPSVVRVIRLDTIAEPWEKFVAFTQVWNFTTEDGSIFQPPDGEPLTLPLPEGAQAVSILQGEEYAEVLPDRIEWTGRIEPAAPGSEITPQLVVRFSMRLPERARRLTPANDLTFRQQMTLTTEGATFVVPRTTTFRKHPTIETRMQARICVEPNDTGCFRRTLDEAPPGLLRDGTPAMALVGGRVAAGDILEVHTEGWPAPTRSERRWALLIGLLAALVGAGIFATQWARFGRQRNVDHQREILEDRRRDLVAQAEALADAWERGELRSADMEREKERIREHLGVVLRRLRQRDTAPSDQQVGG